MRTIKFRAKNIDTGKWAYGDVIHCSDGSCRILTPLPAEEAFRSYNAKPATVGQYTGLNDCDGKEIYEGDIVQYKDFGIDEVYWNDETASFDLSRELNITLFSEDSALMKVVGNIHDNPEMLKGGKP